MTDDRQPPRTGTPMNAGYPTDPNAVGSPTVNAQDPKGDPPIVERLAPAPPNVPSPTASMGVPPEAGRFASMAQQVAGAQIPADAPPIAAPVAQMREPSQQIQPPPTADPAEFEHDVVKQLKQELGIALVKPEFAEVAGHVWGFRAPMYEDYVWVMGNITGDVTVHEFHALLQAATLAITITSIDGVPSFQLFGIEQMLDNPAAAHTIIPDPMNPPILVRQMAAERMLGLLRSELWTVLVPLLWTQYDEKIETQMRVAPRPFDQKTSDVQTNKMNTFTTGEKS